MEKYKLLEEIKKILIENKLSLSCAESCTGGLISSYLTDISGSSEYIFQNFVTYSNKAKTKYLGVDPDVLRKYGAVSSIVANQMAKGLLKDTDCAISTTGILGPLGGSEEKPVGLVYIGLGYKNEIKVMKYISNKKNRYDIKKDIVEVALLNFLEFLKFSIDKEAVKGVS